MVLPLPRAPRRRSGCGVPPQPSDRQGRRWSLRGPPPVGAPARFSALCSALPTWLSRIRPALCRLKGGIARPSLRAIRRPWTPVRRHRLSALLSCRGGCRAAWCGDRPRGPRDGFGCHGERRGCAAARARPAHPASGRAGPAPRAPALLVMVSVDTIMCGRVGAQELAYYGIAFAPHMAVPAFRHRPADGHGGDHADRRRRAAGGVRPDLAPRAGQWRCFRQPVRPAAASGRPSSWRSASGPRSRPTAAPCSSCSRSACQRS